MATSPPQGDPFVEAHRSRYGRRDVPLGEPRRSLADRDTATALMVGFLPTEEALEGKDFPGLEEFREEHERHTEQCLEANALLRTLSRKFGAEDDAHEQAIRDAYVEGTDPDSLKDKRTRPGVRAQQLEDARRRARLAEEAAYEWARGALADARTHIFDWTAAIAESQSGARNRIEKLNAELDELKFTLLKDQRLESWVKRLDLPTPGLVMAYSQLMELPMAEPPSQPGPYGQAARRMAQAARGLPVT